LHVVFDGGGETETALPGGGVAPVVALRPWVERRSAELRAWLERSSPWREPCHSAITRQGVPAVRGLLAAEGLARLQAKAAVCARTVADIGADETLYRALCSALGLNRNVEPFDILARRLFAGDLLSETSYLSAVEAEAMIRARLHTVAGFGVEAPPLGALPWRLDGIRPGAHPTKRLDALATLLVRHRAGLARELRRASHSGGRALLRAVQAPGIGRDRAVEIAINGVLPWLIATGDERVACDLATTLPAAAPYGVLVTLSTALTDPHPTTSAPSRSLVAAGALAQQGALALHHGWCRRGGCGVCPLS